MYSKLGLERFYMIAKLLRYPMGSLKKVDFIPLEIEINCSLKAVEMSTE